MPDFSAVDTHLHLWQVDRFDYPWLNDIPPLNRSFLLKDFHQHSEEVDISYMVFVQCDTIASQGLDEASWIASLADVDARIKGIVAFAPIEDGTGVKSYLDELVQIPKIKGVRRLLHILDDSEFCLQPSFIKGLHILSDYNLSFDICMRHDQLSSGVQMVQQCPDLQFMLDHIGVPDIKNKVFDSWCDDIRALADFDNVYCKISGVVTTADHQSWTVDEISPYINHAIDCFGWDRIAYGGDWPVSTLATTYPRWVEVLDQIVSGVSNHQKRKLYRENAIKFYQLEK